MSDSGISLGVPTTGKVEAPGERNYTNQQDPKKQKKKENEQEAASAETKAGGHFNVVKQRAQERVSKETDSKDNKGVFVDIVA